MNPFTEARFHHGSHNHLLRRVEVANLAPASVSAVVVPTARPVACLREAMRLGRELDCLILVLCSRSASAREAVELGGVMGVATIAVDVDPVTVKLPDFATAEVLAGTMFASTADLSLKRNLGLHSARALGWERVLFLDDDISRGSGDEVSRAAGLLDEYRVVGLHNTGYPDNSVVCHAFRAAGGRQDTFVGGGAMLVRPEQTQSFFPNVYNEDWFFLLGDGPLRALPVTGQVKQKPYDPFADPERAKAEEFGDCLAEGLYWLLDEGRGVIEADIGYWRDFLYRRRCFLDSVLARLRWGRRRPAGWDRIVASVHAARQISSFISPKLCVDYLHAWWQDLGRWQTYLDDLNATDSLRESLSKLGLEQEAILGDPSRQAR